MRALVYKSTGIWYTVQTSSGETFNARMKGKLKIGDITSTNPIAVGDWVIVEHEPGTENKVINEIEERRNYINRVSPRNNKQHHIIAANIDQSILFATLVDPKTSLGFIDRFLVTSEAYHTPAIIVYNKSDLLKKKDWERYEEIKSMYEDIGYAVMRMSINKQEGVEEVRELLKGKTTLLSGHSGVGKSSFLNLILPELSLKTQNVSGWSGKGLHTTSFAEMFDLPFGGRVIDTPGIRELGLVDIPRQELSHYFPEMRSLLNSCQFNDCIHVDEPGCAIKNAVINGSIQEDRYISYRKILDTISENDYS